MKLLFIILALSVFSDRRLDYIGKHPELSREIIDAIQRGEFVKGMPEDAVYAMVGRPLERTVFGNYQGLEVTVFCYKDYYLFLVNEGKGLVLIDWKRREKDN